jgi:hypothetical protein
VSGQSDGTVTAPTVAGYRFLCWVACVSVGWVGICYIEHPTNTTSKIWYVTQLQNSGGGRVDCFALYVHQ